MRALIVLSLDVDDVDGITDALLHINPPSIPNFSGEARLVVPPESHKVEEWLDEPNP